MWQPYNIMIHAFGVGSAYVVANSKAPALQHYFFTKKELFSP